MREILDYFKNKKNLLNLLVLGILVLAVPIGVSLIRQQQILKSRAANTVLTFVAVPNVTTQNPADQSWKTTSSTVTLSITAPYPPTATQSSSQTVRSKDSPTGTVFAEGFSK